MEGKRRETGMREEEGKGGKEEGQRKAEDPEQQDHSDLGSKEPGHQHWRTPHGPSAPCWMCVMRELTPFSQRKKHTWEAPFASALKLTLLSCSEQDPGARLQPTSLCRYPGAEITVKARSLAREGICHLRELFQRSLHPNGAAGNHSQLR